LSPTRVFRHYIPARRTRTGVGGPLLLPAR
jgi:hypothetical protein